MKSRILLIGAALAAVSGGFANAASNNPPPAGAILDLNGTPITNTDQVYTVNFAAALTNTAITFAFRQDPSFLTFSNASVVDLTHPSANLLVDGQFNVPTDVGSSNATGWTYANIYGATFQGVVGNSGECGDLGTCWYDGSVQAYDALSQSIATTIGDTYRISFTLNGGGCSGACFYSDLSTNGDTTDTGGNGINVTAYAQAGLPAAGGVPEPATWAMFLLGFGAIGWTLRGRRNQSAATA
jgi:hypothetical protein